jgi:hypothetical protein
VSEPNRAWWDERAPLHVARQHRLGDVVTAVIEAGLTIELLREHDFTAFQRRPFLAEGRMPERRPRLPLMFCQRARLP